MRVSVPSLLLAAALASAQSSAPVSPGANEWTWMGGSSTVAPANPVQPGVYGTLGTPAAGNIPTGRYSASSWTDSSGNFWLFGGQLVDSQSGAAQWNFLNDFWMFNPSTNEWVWLGGSSTLPAGPCTSNYCGQPGVYGSLGEFAAGNAPGGRYQAVSSTDKNGNFWLFGGFGYDANGACGELNDLWEFNPSTKQWAWMGGSSLVPVQDCTDYVYGQPGVYGTLGTPAGGNVPGGRQGASSWTDNSGNFWLFGGFGFDANDSWAYLNDLWEFNPSTKEWAWMGGSSTVVSPGVSQPGVYGTLGKFAPGNIPGGRGLAANWTDSSGNLWLFGGEVGGNSSALNLNDLWEFNPSTKEWAWMDGSGTVDQFGIYGAMGTPAPANVPGSRESATLRTDASGNLWLFGGLGYDVNGNYFFLNDLWEFNPFTLEWTWSGGSSTGDKHGVYGTLGTPALGNVPGSRQGAASWTDNSGNFWIFAGWGHDSNTEYSYLNDLWVYQPVASLPAAATPTFSIPSGIYATAQTVTISDTTPNAVIYYTTDRTAPTVDSSVYGTPIPVSSTETIEAIATATGYSNSVVATATYTIAESDIATNTTLAASAHSLTAGQTLTLTATVTAASGATPTGTVAFLNGTASLGSAPLNSNGVATLTLTPAAGSYSITASYGGSSIDAPSQSAPPALVTVSAAGLIATTTTLSASATNLVAGQTLTLTATVAAQGGGAPTGTVTFYNGGAILGTGAISNGVATLKTAALPVGNNSITAAYPGDASFGASQSPALSITVTAAGIGGWTWMGGSSMLGSAFGRSGVYGTLGTPAEGNIPGSRDFATSWTDPAGNFWLSGGMGLDANGSFGSLNDLWEFNPAANEWAWMSGSSTISCGVNGCGQPGVYGTLGTPAVGNVTGAREYASSWIDSSGNLWLYGGMGFDANGNYGLLNDLWEFHPSTNLWAWMGGSSTNLPNGEGQPPAYGTQGEYAAGNNPGGLFLATTWTDNSGHFWLFGGDGYYSTGVSGTFNDLWEFNPAINEWAWMNGSSTAGSNCPGGGCVHPGVYGALGTPAAGNNPGSRSSAASWTDGGGHLWLFGGSVTGPRLTYLDDLWEFYPSTNEWAWMGGSSTVDQAGVYGTLGTASTANIPGSRCCMVNWTDSSGDLWLFGGQGYDSQGNQGDQNDLWKFDPLTNGWAWMGGSSAPPCGGLGCYAPGVYGTLGVTDPGNIPGSREAGVSWSDKSGNFWLFGGDGADANDSLGNLNDLWEYQAAQGSPEAATPTFNPPAGSYPTTQSVTISDATPGAIIYYAINGIPTTSSSVYSTPITVSTSETIEAIATAAAYSTSQVASATYNVAVATTTTLSAVPTTLNVGQTLTLTATVTAASGATPAGTVTFYNGAASLGSKSLNGNGAATFALTPAAGNYFITAGYGGDTDLQRSVSAPVAVNVISPDIYTYAGSAIFGWGGDGGPATVAELCTPGGVALDLEGNLYFTEPCNSDVRKVDAATGFISAIAGNRIQGFKGDGGPAAAAEFNGPTGIAVDAAGDIYIADSQNNRIREIDAHTGIITTVAGDATEGYNGDGGRANSAALNGPQGVALDVAGNLYIADSNNERIREIIAATGIITTVAGSGVAGYSGDGGPASGAELDGPTGIALSSAGDIYISDLSNHRIRVVTAGTGIIATVAGNGIEGDSGDGGPATRAEVDWPVGIALDGASDLYLTDDHQNTVREVDAATGTIVRIAGTGAYGYGGDGGPAINALLEYPEGIVLDAAGNIYVADYFNDRIRVVGAAPIISLIPTTTTLTASAMSLSMGQTLTLAATVTPTGGATPTGTVTFYNGTASLGSAQLNSNGVATIALTPAVGSYSITASYAGSSTDASSVSSPPVSVTVIAAATTTTLAASPDPSPFGATVILSATVGSSAGTPGGSVSFYDGGALLGTATLASGVATYSTSALSVGSHQMTATYVGGTGFSASTSNVFVEVISAADFSISASPSAQSVYTGETATYKVTITPGTGFNLPVTLSCSQLPANTTCYFPQFTVPAGGTSAALIVQTSAPSAAPKTSLLSTRIRVAALAGLLLLFIPGRLRRRRNGWPIILAIFALFAVGAFLGGCSAPGPLTGGTPVGSQTVEVTGVATNGSQTLTHVTTVTLNVKSLF